jgi:CBS domain-containing protein
MAGISMIGARENRMVTLRPPGGACLDQDQSSVGRVFYDGLAVRRWRKPVKRSEMRRSVKGRHMPISEFCNPNVVCGQRETTIVDAARLMRQHHVGDVVVVDQVEDRRVPVGIVTDRDIVVEVVATSLDPKLLKLGDILTEPLVTVGEDEGYAATIYQMVERGVRRMPVVGANGALIGIITFDDLFRQLATPLAELSELAGRERRAEMRKRQ